MKNSTLGYMILMIFGGGLPFVYGQTQEVSQPPYFSLVLAGIVVLVLCSGIIIQAKGRRKTK